MASEEDSLYSIEEELTHSLFIFFCFCLSVRKQRKDILQASPSMLDSSHMQRKLLMALINLSSSILQGGGGNFHLKVGGPKISGNAGHPLATILGAVVI